MNLNRRELSEHAIKFYNILRTHSIQTDISLSEGSFTIPNRSYKIMIKNNQGTFHLTYPSPNKIIEVQRNPIQQFSAFYLYHMQKGINLPNYMFDEDSQSMVKFFVNSQFESITDELESLIKLPVY